MLHLKGMFYLIHGLIRPPESGFKGSLPGITLRQSGSDRIVLPGIKILLLKGFFEGFIELVQKICPVREITVLQNRDKLVSADTENRRMLKGLADDFAAAPQVFLYRVMAVNVIDIL